MRGKVVFLKPGSGIILGENNKRYMFTQINHLRLKINEEIYFIPKETSPDLGEAWRVTRTQD
jgi:hypothetical protein